MTMTIYDHRGFSRALRLLGLGILGIALMALFTGCHTQPPPGADTAVIARGIATSDRATASAQGDAKQVRALAQSGDAKVREARAALDAADHKEAVLDGYFQWLRAQRKGAK